MPDETTAPPTKKTPVESKVNIPIGSRFTEFSRLAKSKGISKGALGRILICDGLDRVKKGEIQITGPSLISQSAEPQS